MFHFWTSVPGIKKRRRVLVSQNASRGIFNTDGIQLYASSGNKLWPIYIAINELPKQHRFAKKNMILAGLWQGKSQPSYYHYMHEFDQEMSKLYFDGILIDLKGNYGRQTVKFGVFLRSVDLPAKCKIDPI